MVPKDLDLNFTADVKKLKYNGMNLTDAKGQMSITNGNIILMLDMAKRAGLPWDAILGAEVTQAYKPMPEAYLRAVDVLAMRPDEVCLVAAHNDDLAAARRCGLRTAFVPRPLEHGPGQSTDLHAKQEWDIVADDFEQLAGRLGL